MIAILFLASLLFWFITCVRLAIAAASSEGWKKRMLVSLTAMAFVTGFALLAFVEA